MKEFVKKMIKSHIIVLNALLKQYKDLGGDVSSLDEGCPVGYYYNETAGRCVLDVGEIGDPGE